MATIADVNEPFRPNYETSRPEVQELVPTTARRILDLGCSSGMLGEAIKRRQSAEVVGVDLSEEFAARATDRLDQVIVANIESFVNDPGSAGGRFDCLVAADVLEHLVDPWTTLKQSVALLEPGATVVVSLPNVFYWKTLLRAIASRRWPRDHEGIFDRTHIRWFGARDAADLLAGAGLTSVVVRPNYWALKRWLFLVRALGRTPIRDFLGGQHLATGIVPG